MVCDTIIVKGNSKIRKDMCIYIYAFKGLKISIHTIIIYP